MQGNEMAGGHIRKGDAITSIAAGTVIALSLNVWHRIAATLENIDSDSWLARIHRPAGRFAERVAYFLYPKIGYPWSVRYAVVCGYVVLISMWVLAAFAVLKIGRLIMGLEARFRMLILLSLVICCAGYLGLALTRLPVYTAAGMIWSLTVLATWMVTIMVSFRRCGRKAIWMLLEAPVVLLPFYVVFLVEP
jgi:hypothetical protein